MLVHDVMRLSTYEEAQKYLLLTAPIKSPSNTLKVRPLGGRRYWGARWIRLDESDMSIEVGTYSKDTVARFYADDRIEIHFGRWNLCNRQILGALFRNKLNFTYANNRKFYVTDIASNTNYVVNPLKPLVLQFDGAKYVGKTVVEHKEFVKRKAMSQVRKEYAPLLTYMHAINKLSGGDVAEITSVLGYADAENIFASLRGKEMEENEEAFQLFYDHVAKEGVTTSWVRGVGYVYRLPSNAIDRIVTNYIKLMFSTEVLESREVPNTTIVK